MRGSDGSELDDVGHGGQVHAQASLACQPGSAGQDFPLGMEGGDVVSLRDKR